jgi:hypothetical protein
MASPGIGIFDATDQLAKRGWPRNGPVYMADHYRAAADMLMTWGLSDSAHCNVEVADWFPESDVVGP